LRGLAVQKWAEKAVPIVAARARYHGTKNWNVESSQDMTVVTAGLTRSRGSRWKRGGLWNTEKPRVVVQVQVTRFRKTNTEEGISYNLLGLRPIRIPWVPVKNKGRYRRPCSVPLDPRLRLQRTALLLGIGNRNLPLTPRHLQLFDPTNHTPTDSKFFLR